LSSKVSDQLVIFETSGAALPTVGERSLAIKARKCPMLSDQSLYLKPSVFHTTIILEPLAQEISRFSAKNRG
jgi:hypothetical protein